MPTPKSVKRIVRMNKKFTLGLATLALSIAHASTAQAALITGVTATTDMGNFLPDIDINGVVNGAGLSSLSLNATHAAPDFESSWGSTNQVTTGNITFNLNGLYSLAGLSLWNLGSFASGINEVNIETSTDGTIFDLVKGAPAQFALGTSTPQDPGQFSPQQFSFAPVNASYVRFKVLSNHGDAFFTGLSEVQFNSASAAAVPEPVTIFGTLMGLGGGAALKRRLKGIKSKSVYTKNA
jgi:F5/8 type C domain